MTSNTSSLIVDSSKVDANKVDSSKVESSKVDSDKVDFKTQLLIEMMAKQEAIITSLITYFTDAVKQSFIRHAFSKTHGFYLEVICKQLKIEAAITVSFTDRLQEEITKQLGFETRITRDYQDRIIIEFILDV